MSAVGQEPPLGSVFFSAPRSLPVGEWSTALFQLERRAGLSSSISMIFRQLDITRRTLLFLVEPSKPPRRFTWNSALPSWERFRQMRRCLGYRLGENPRVYRLRVLAAGRPGNGPVHLLLESAGEVGFAWDSAEEGWLRPGLPPPPTSHPPGCFMVFTSTFSLRFYLLGGPRLRACSLRGMVSEAALYLIVRVLSSFFFLLPPEGVG